MPMYAAISKDKRKVYASGRRSNLWRLIHSKGEDVTAFDIRAMKDTEIIEGEYVSVHTLDDSPA